jgi:hypothetical protein
MNPATKGAWLIHHTQKLDSTSSYGFGDIFLSGKCGLLLSALTTSSAEKKISKEKVEALAAANGINTIFELPSLLDTLKKNHLIDLSEKGEVVTLGITTTNVLMHTSNIYEQRNPNKIQNASLLLSELVSQKPILEKLAKEQISDILKLSTEEVSKVLSHSEDFGFIDTQNIAKGDKLLFNGNLFRVENASKFEAVLASVTKDEAIKIGELNNLLDEAGCVTYEKAINTLGKALFSKLQSIGFYDLNTVSNSTESAYFITRPYSFSKYGNPFIEDSLDLAKALVASLAYGILKSTAARGRITDIKALMAKLINGGSVGPADAIGEDYKYLETRGVVSIVKSERFPKAYDMLLLKKDIGEIALKVLDNGQGSDVALLKGSSSSNYINPEKNRMRTRMSQRKDQISDKQLNEIIKTIRTL